MVAIRLLKTHVAKFRKQAARRNLPLATYLIGLLRGQIREVEHKWPQSTRVIDVDAR